MSHKDFFHRPVWLRELSNNSRSPTVSTTWQSASNEVASKYLIIISLIVLVGKCGCAERGGVEQCQIIALHFRKAEMEVMKEPMCDDDKGCPARVCYCLLSALASRG